MKMQDEIFNVEKNISKGSSISDKDYLTYLLMFLKELERNYVMSMSQSSCEEFYDGIFDTFYNISAKEREAYELMFRNGWCKLTLPNENEILKNYKELRRKFKNLEI